MIAEGIIFDFDGTLFDSMGIWDNAGELYLTSLGLAAEPNLGDILAPMSIAQAAEYMRDKYHLRGSVQEIVDGINQTVGNYYRCEVQPKAYVREMLEYFHENSVRMCIATATDHALIEGALRRCSLDQYFQGILTCQEVGHGKDESFIYEHALQLLGLAKENVLVFEDAFYAAKTAVDAGFHVVAVHDAYEKREDELRTIADRYIDDFSCIVNELL